MKALRTIRNLTKVLPGLLLLSACSSPSAPDHSKLNFTQLSPNAGSVSGNEWITLTAEGAGRISSVKIGDTKCEPVIPVGPDQIQCKTAAVTTGAARADVVLTADSSVIRLKNAFSWQVYLGQTDGYAGRQAGMSIYRPLQFKQCGIRYVLADAGNARVLIYNRLPTSVQVQPDLVLGQPSGAYTGAQANANEDYLGSMAARSIYPYGLACDSNRLIVTDYNQNRAMIWNSFPTMNNQAADLVLGQPSFSTTTQNTGGLSASSLSGPTGAWLDGERLIVADYKNNRVLIWNTFPTTNGQAATYVVGQADFVSALDYTSGVSASTLYHPISAMVVAGKLVVSDSGNSRVLIYQHVPSINNAAATVVLGQSSMTGRTCNGSGIPAANICVPVGIASDGVRFVVSDQGNHRVLVWNSVPTSSTSLADAVLGQPDFSTVTINTGGRSASSMYDPYLSSFVLGKFAVADYSNHRILMWSLSSLTTHAAADLVFGQVDATVAQRNIIPANEKNVMVPTTPWSDGVRMAVADSTYNRVMIWNSIPKTSDAAADIVLGQSSFTASLPNRSASGSAPTASTLSAPSSVFSLGNKLLVADKFNNRVLIWNSFPTTNGQAADLVLGQADFVSNSNNRGGSPAANTLSSPYQLWTDGTRLIVCDTDNSRVLIWNSFPTTNGQAADLVVGQPGVNSGTSNNGGISLSSMSYPTGVWVVGSRLLVSDTVNNRVLIWNTFPSSNGQAASLVLGQPSSSVITPNTGGIGGATLSNPRELWSDGVSITVADQQNNRILVWDRFPSVTGQAADRVVGQRGFLNSDYWIAPGRYPSVSGASVWGGLWFSASQGTGAGRVVITPAQ